MTDSTPRSRHILPALVLLGLAAVLLWLGLTPPDPGSPAEQVLMTRDRLAENARLALGMAHGEHARADKVMQGFALPPLVRRQAGGLRHEVGDGGALRVTLDSPFYAVEFDDLGAELCAGLAGITMASPRGQLVALLLDGAEIPPFPETLTEARIAEGCADAGNIGWRFDARITLPLLPGLQLPGPGGDGGSSEVAPPTNTPPPDDGQDI